MEYSDLTFEDFKKTFKSVKRNKAAGHNDIDSNVTIKVYDEIRSFRERYFTLHKSFSKGIFPEQLKVAKVSSTFKVDNIEEIRNYRPISVLPIFSKVIERIMYNRIYQYFKENNILLRNNLAFQ